MEEAIYHELAEHLNRLPGGFPQSKTNAHIQLLKHLFTEEEAKLATQLTLTQKTAQQIAETNKQPHEPTKKLLDTMVMKGLIFSKETENGETVYQALPWVIGIYETQVNNLTDELRTLLKEYWSTREPSEKHYETQLRTIPINKSIEPTLEILPYEEVNKLVEENTVFAVAPCICRTHEKKEGRGCDAPIESCLVFGEFADYYVKLGLGRYISREEMKEKIREADEHNLVLNPTNSKRVSAICCCCGCCCGILGGLKRNAKPAEVITSSFHAEYDADNCIGCGVCVDRCQMEAITRFDDKVALDLDRCIGCGLCVSTCPSDALRLIRKTELSHDLPETMFDTWYKMTEDSRLRN
jgi:electron transport complex protein RnfB